MHGALKIWSSLSPLFSCYRGFGFVTFADTDGVDKVLAHNTHELDSKIVSFFHIIVLFDRFVAPAKCPASQRVAVLC